MILPPAALGVRRLPSRFSLTLLKADPVFKASNKLSITPSWSPSRKYIKQLKKIKCYIGM